MDSVNQQRRKWLSLGGICLGASLLPNSVLAALSTPAPRILTIHNVNTGETLTSRFFDGGTYVAAELHKLNHLFRDRRTNQVKRIDPRLFSKLYSIQSRLGVRKAQVQLLSGYRSAQSNALLRRQSRGVASNSYHTRGQAMDFYIPGVPLARLKNTAESFANGGVGYYPRSNFVHIDTGSVRTWRG